MGGCQGKSALGEGDVPYEKKPKPGKSQKRTNGKQKHAKFSIHTYPIDIPILVQETQHRCQHHTGNGHEQSHPRAHERCQHHKGNGHVHGNLRSHEEPQKVGLITEPEFPSYGPDISRSESCDPDTPLPQDGDSSPSCDPDSGDSPEMDSPLVDDAKTGCIPASDSGIYSLYLSSQETTPTAFSSPQSDGSIPRTISEEGQPSVPQTSSPAGPVVNSSYTQTIYPGSLDNILEGGGSKPVPPSNLPVKRFLSHHGLPPPRPQSDSRFSFKRLKKRKGGGSGGRMSRESWKSQDSFDISSMLRTGLSRTNSECSEMCLCDELYNIQAPLAQFDSILTMDSPSCGSLNRLPHNLSVENVIDVPSGQLTCTCSVCKGDSSSPNVKISSQPASQRNSWSEHHSRCEGVPPISDPTPGEVTDDPGGVMTVCIDGKDMVVLDVDTYTQLLSDLALVKVKLQRIYNLLLQEEFDSISDIINNSGLESCLVDT